MTTQPSTLFFQARGLVGPRTSNDPTLFFSPWVCSVDVVSLRSLNLHCRNLCTNVCCRARRGSVSEQVSASRISHECMCGRHVVLRVACTHDGTR